MSSMINQFMRSYFKFFLPVVLFSMGVSFVELPFLADDWWWLSLPIRNPSFDWYEPYSFSRMPVSTLLTVFTLKLHLWEHWPKALLTFFFCFHTAGFLLLEKTLSTLKQPGLPLSLISALFILYPGNYEIHLWHILSIHSVGCFLMGVGFNTRARFLQVLFFFLALATYDTFVFLLVGMVAAHWLIKGKETGKIFLMPALLAICLTPISKLGLGQLTGKLHVVRFETDFVEVLNHLKVVLQMLGSLHFYKVHWVATLAHLLCVISLLTRVRRKLSFIIVILPFLAALPLCLNTYSAPRAYYGPLLLQSVIWSILVKESLQNQSKAILNRLVLVVSMIALLYVIEWIYIFQNKNSNSERLKCSEAKLLSRTDLCDKSKALLLPEPNEGLNRDYILPAFVWDDYYFRFLSQHCAFGVPHYQIETPSRSR